MASDLKELQLKTPWGVPLTGLWRENQCDCGILTSCIQQDEYMLQAHRLGPGMTAVDLGANIGAVTMALASLGVNTVAVEMLPENVNLLEQNLARNNLDATVVSAAISDENNKTVRAYYGDPETAKGRGHFFIGEMSEYPRLGPTERRSFIDVPTLSISSLFYRYQIKHCHYMKVDVEGGEWAAFKDLNIATLKSIDILHGELHPRYPGEPLSHGDLLPCLKGCFIDVSEKFDPVGSSIVSTPHFVYYNKNFTGF